MKIWWCEEHEHPGLAENVCFYPLWYQHKMEGRMSAFREAAANCRMVPMRLIPDNAETVDREDVSRAILQVTSETISYVPLALSVDVLVAAARELLALDGETP